MSRAYRLSATGRKKRSARMKALNADPAFKAKTSARMKALHADPAFNPLAGMSSHQRKVYHKLIRCGIEPQRASQEARAS